MIVVVNRPDWKGEMLILTEGRQFASSKARMAFIRREARKARATLEEIVRAEAEGRTEEV